MKKAIFNPKIVELELNENEIHIWNIDLDQVRNSTSAVIKLLNEEEIIRANKFHFEADKERFICSRGILKLLINAYIKIPLTNISFIKNNFGKPELSKMQNSIQLNFNVSHSKNIFCFAFSIKEQVGIDIEIVKPISDYMQISERYFSKSEIEQLKSLSEKDRLEGFYSCWTGKEAVIKLLGKGLSFPLKDFDVQTKNIEIGNSFCYSIKVKNIEKIISIEIFRPHEKIYGAYAVGLETFSTIHFEFDESIYPIKNFLEDYLK
jgi:4'-phosphopantetheinyl transferase